MLKNILNSKKFKFDGEEYDVINFVEGKTKTSIFFDGGKSYMEYIENSGRFTEILFFSHSNEKYKKYSVMLDNNDNTYDVNYFDHKGIETYQHVSNTKELESNFSKKDTNKSMLFEKLDESVTGQDFALISTDYNGIPYMMTCGEEYELTPIDTNNGFNYIAKFSDKLIFVKLDLINKTLEISNTNK